MGLNENTVSRRNLAKIFVVSFCWLFNFGGCPGTRPGKIPKVVACARTVNQQDLSDFIIHAQSMRKDVRGPNVSLFVCFFDFYRAS